MKKMLKVIIAVTIAIVWVVSMFFFVPYDLKTDSLPDDKPNVYFSMEDYMLKSAFEMHFDDADAVKSELADAEYECISAEDTYDILMEKSNNPVDGFSIRVSSVFSNAAFDNGKVADITFFVLDSENYVMFTLTEQHEQKFRLLSRSYVIYETDEFGEDITEKFINSKNIISKPAENSAIEAMIQSLAVALAYGIFAFVIYIVITTVMYKKEQRGKKLSDDETTTDGDIKKYIKNKLGSEFFDEEKVFSMPCLTVDVSGVRAKELICLIAENCNADEVFIGGFFEKKCFIDEECENAVFIKEYLDENSYSSINPAENEAVIEWIINGNNNGETAVSFYIQEMNILIYPAKNKLYIFSKNSSEVYYKLATFINPTDYNLRF